MVVKKGFSEALVNSLSPTRPATESAAKLATHLASPRAPSGTGALRGYRACRILGAYLKKLILTNAIPTI